jgi:TusA-related sulfurtransferase
MAKFVSKSNLTCPICKTTEKLKMPTDQCTIVHNCINCGELLRPANGDCCTSDDKQQDLSIITLDLLGFFCPIPVHETRKTLQTTPQGAILEVICDDPETLQDIPILCKRLNIQLLEIKDEAGELIFVIKNQTLNED